MEFNLIRIAFAFLFSLEFLNSIKILNWPSYFPWILLSIISFSCWFLWEKIFKKKIEFPLLIGGLAIFLLYADFLGNVFGFYFKYWWYDHLTHFIGGAMIGAAIFLVLKYFNKTKSWGLGFKSLAIFGISLALSLGVIYEFYEFFIEAVLSYNKIIADKYDTCCDLLFDLLGAITLITFLAFTLRKKESPPL